MGYAAMCASTAYPPGALTLTPSPAHLGVDAALGLALAAAPWPFGFSHGRASRNFCLGMSAVTAVGTSLTERRRAA